MFRTKSGNLGARAWRPFRAGNLEFEQREHVKRITCIETENPNKYSRPHAHINGEFNVIGITFKPTTLGYKCRLAIVALNEFGNPKEEEKQNESTSIHASVKMTKEMDLLPS